MPTKTPFAFLVFLIIAISTAGAADIYVATNGNDTNLGTKERPLLTLNMALRKAREMRRLRDPAISGGIHIIVAAGTYAFDESLFIRPEDSGTAESPTTIEAQPGNKTVFSGGVQLSGWKRTGSAPGGLPQVARNKIWETDVPYIGAGVMEFRQLWINDRKAVRAKLRNGDSMNRIYSWDHSAQTTKVPRFKGADLSAVKGIEMFIHQWWAIATLRIKSVVNKGDTSVIAFHQPESRVQSEHPWPAPWISSETGNSAFNLTNAIQFLDEPGEWFLDLQRAKVYYWPLEGENMANAKVIAPALETLVKIEGTPDNPVSNIFFKGISFEHTGWLRPSKQGHVPHQAGMYMIDAYKLKVPGTPDKKSLENQAWVGRPAAAVEVSYADYTGFQGCRFEHLASTGLDYHKAVHNATINGNLFKDIGGTAILAGVFSDPAVEVHLPYEPKDEREISGDLRITNNLINDVTNEDWGCVGIGAGFVRNTHIAHNDISDIAYTGIMLGWGWTRTLNAMRNNHIVGNRIHHFGKQMYDVAGIYSLSAQPNSLISENYIDSIYKAPYAHLPNHWFYIYTDEGTAYASVTNNWTPSKKYLQNANGPGNTWLNNGPATHDSVKRTAGLQPAYQSLLKEKRPLNTAWKINHELPAMIELVVAPGTQLDTQRLRAVLVQNNINPEAVYHWNNRYVIFENVQDESVIQGKLRSAFPQAKVKVYFDVVYEFNRSRCSDTATAREWAHTILTANLVSDPKLQREYLYYHNTQFEKWPELSQGFCNASFQQLLIYKSGRQLMLVISIPKGESLDKLNPKTTENNPRVDQWNTLMKKYQEGIEGTKPGEVWVEVKKLKIQN
ncbi:L-rhamnose mutarotase [Segetibacter sp. 3557_3]|nr:L-rhamnose mutarotase [Segetibacter sp. 3557_3]